MYFPYLSKRTPSNRECRVASTVGIIGFVAFAWLALATPGALVQMLTGLVAVELILGYFGLCTLYIARPNHFVFWPQRETRVVRGQPVPSLDERDLNIRYRTFLVSYRILSVVVFAIIALRPAAALLVENSRGHIPHWRLEAAGQMFLFLILLLSVVLPYLVFPWLESDTAFDDDQPSGSGLRDAAQLPPPQRRWHWIRRGVELLIICVTLFLLMTWTYHRYTHSNWPEPWNDRITGGNPSR